MFTPTHSEPLHAYASLQPDVVLDALATLNLQSDGRLLALSSYENRVYQIGLDDGSRVVAKFYRPERWSEAQILEEHAFTAALTAAEIPAVAPMQFNGATLHQFNGFYFSICPYRGGRAPELDNYEVLEWIGRFLARIHAVGATQSFKHRPALNLLNFGTASRDWLLANQAIPLDMQSRWRVACEKVLEKIASFEALCMPDTAKQTPTSTIQHIRLHGDCHPGNILWTPTELPSGGPHFVDLDDARTGPAVQDLWMLLSGDRAQRSRQLGILLDGYEQFRPFNRAELSLIEPLRSLRLLHYSAWLARRWSDPTFPINFPWFGSSDYWQGQVQMLEEQLEAMDEAPLCV